MDTKNTICKSNREMVDGLCYEKCPDNTTRIPGIPTNCQGPKGISYETKTSLPTITNRHSYEALCPDDKDKVTSSCYNKCPTDTTRVPGAPTQCTGMRGISYTTDVRTPTITNKKSYMPSCRSESEKIGALCYRPCPGGLKRVPGIPTQCIGDRGISYVTDTKPAVVTLKIYEPHCKSNRVKKDSLCYKKCEDEWGKCFIANEGAATECVPNRGLSYIPPVTGCGDELSYDGTSMCNNNYIPETYEKGYITASCGSNRDRVGVACYEKCPTITDSKGEKIQLGHITGIPTQCGPPRGNNYPLTYAIGLPSYFPQTVFKVRTVAMSTK